jgi:hypothetical protein
MRGVETSVTPFVEALRIPTLLPPDVLTLGFEYLISLEGLNVSPERISLGADLADEVGLVAADIVFIGWLAVLTFFESCYIILWFMLSSIFCFGKFAILLIKIWK